MKNCSRLVSSSQNFEKKVQENQRISLARMILIFPTLFWISTNDWFIHFLLALGTISGLSIFLGTISWTTHLLCSLICVAIYLSISTVSTNFFRMTCDFLLVEMGYISVFSHFQRKLAISLSMLLHLRFLVSNSARKIQDQDRFWEEGSTLSYYYHSQPLPNRMSYYFHNAPLLNQLGLIALFLNETFAVFLPFYFPTSVDITFFSFFCSFSFQVWFIISGNVGFQGFLLILSSFAFLDDKTWISSFQEFGATHNSGLKFIQFIQTIHPNHSNNTPSQFLLLLSFSYVLLSINHFKDCLQLNWKSIYTSKIIHKLNGFKSFRLLFSLFF